MVAIAAALGAVYLAAKTWLVHDETFPVELWTVGAIAALLFTFLPACILTSEYVKSMRVSKTWRQRSAGLNSKEISALMRWAPISYKLTAAAGLLVVVGTALKFGAFTFQANQAFDPAKVPGLFLGFCAFYLLSLPVLGSAARMPKTYATSRDA